MRNVSIIICLDYLKREDTEREWNGDRNVNPKRYDAMIAKLKSLRPQPKQEWSEEDEKMLNSILDEYKSMVTEKRNWLKSIPERFNLQPKQKWNEENWNK